MEELVCNPIRHRLNALLIGLRNGVILGSTEAALNALELIKNASGECSKEFRDFLRECIPLIIASRPSSQVLENLIRMYLEKFLTVASEGGLKRAIDETPTLVDQLVNSLNQVREAIAEIGSKRIESGDTILTHSYSTTVMRTLEKALERGVSFNVYVTESRPVGEGKTTASMVSKLGIDTTLIVDSAVRYVMKYVRKVLVGADAIAINGAVVSKIGTSAVALAAKEARARLFVLAGLYKFSFETVFGELVEQAVLRNPELIIPEDRIAELAGRVTVDTPLFDVTPPEYIDAIITEKGVLAPQAIPMLIMMTYGWPPKVRSLGDLLEEVGRL
ncbi:MAG: hypothetical protein QXX81_03905 [Zestosphaera sp.]